MRLLAISDLHLNHKRNRAGLAAMAHYPEDWLIVAGDVGERVEHLRFALDQLQPRFAQVIWTPGNHDLWCPYGNTDRTRGQARYDELVNICRGYGVLTPEDPYPLWPGVADTSASSDTSATSDTSAIYVCPLFLLYDYTFRPPEITREAAIAWAREAGVGCGDEAMLDPTPWPSREAWCEARCDATFARLDALPADAATVLISHWPMRYDLARPPRVPRFSLWCGTTRTEQWPRRFRARAVVSGHLHMRTTIVRHGVRHEEVSLGYPRDWQQDRGVDWYLRDVLPASSLQSSRFVPARDPFMMPHP
jgi:3',5'-cyclic AMP phosphodiesterase CpdA